MNDHLEPVFKILLPALEDAGIDYWIYGGIGIADITGGFIRNNRDVDIFVRETDYSQAKIILEGICNKHSNVLLKSCNLLNKGIYTIIYF